MHASSSLKSFTLVTVAAAATALLIQACGGGAHAQSTDEDPIEGVWESVITVKDCGSGAVLRSFKGESQLHRGGSLTADNSLPPSSRGIALGNWLHGSGSNYTSNFRFLRFNPDGTLAGSQKVQRTLTLSSDRSALTGTIAGQVLDPAEVVLQPICGTETAVRIY